MTNYTIGTKQKPFSFLRLTEHEIITMTRRISNDPPPTAAAITARRDVSRPKVELNAKFQDDN